MNIIIVLSIIPVVIWSFMMPLSLRFADINSITTSVGQILGLIGMTLFSINLILAGRFKFLDRYFKGLDKVYVNHSKIGSISFSFLLFHPLFLVVKYILISTSTAALFFVPFTDMPITWGIISLSLMIILISTTFYIKLKYNIWKISHKGMTIAFIFAIIHTLMISSDVSRNHFLAFYILSLAIIGLLVSIRQVFLSNFKKKLNFRVKNVKQLNQDIVEIEMEPLGKVLSFIPGQFAFFSFISSNVSSESHPFSISSSSKDNNLKITVKNLGDYTSLLKNLKEGDSVIVDGPYGNFSYKNILNKNQIWVAGGIGVTPFFSMANDLDDSYNINFYYTVKDTIEAVYVKEFNEISQKNFNFKFKLWSTKDNGYINGESIVNLSNGLKDKDIFFCGPPVLMESLKEQFVLLGVDVKKIHYENFNF